jgi:hypothetical protein
VAVGNEKGITMLVLPRGNQRRLRAAKGDLGSDLTTLLTFKFHDQTMASRVAVEAKGQQQSKEQVATWRKLCTAPAGPAT